MGFPRSEESENDLVIKPAGDTTFYEPREAEPAKGAKPLVDDTPAVQLR